MPTVVEMEIESIKEKHPTPEEMSKWASKYSFNDWEKLIRNKSFLVNFPLDLNKATEIANKIVPKKVEEELGIKNPS